MMSFNKYQFHWYTWVQMKLYCTMGDCTNAQLQNICTVNPEVSEEILIFSDIVLSALTLLDELSSY